jgi:DNA-binding transcriptional LysR family regulator
MDWGQVRTLLEVARAGQFLSAARRLGINHTTVGRQLSALEEELKTKLLERHTTGCTLTGSGEALLAAAERAESEITGTFTESIQASSLIWKTKLYRLHNSSSTN